MTEEQYQEFLKQAPKDHFSDEFIQFLREKNKVVKDTSVWLIIENVKNPKDYTAFYIRQDWKNLYFSFLTDLSLLHEYADREWKIKAPHKRSVKLFHVHLIEKPQQNVV